MDDFADLDELADEFDNADFNEAAAYVQTTAKSLSAPVLLKLYSYYKQFTAGACAQVGSKPSWYDAPGKAKYKAWLELGDMDRIVARDLYIAEVQQLMHQFSAAGGGDQLLSTNTNGPIWVTHSTMATPLTHDENRTEPDAQLKALLDIIQADDLASFRDIVNASPALLSARINDEKLTLLHYAADRAASNIMKYILENGRSLDINTVDVEGQTALHYASACGHLECCKLLISNGADVEIRNADGVTASQLAEDDLVQDIFKS